MSDPSDHIAHGTPDALREFIAENIHLASIQGEIVQRYASLGNDAGLEYALRCFAAYSKAAFDTLADLKRENAREVQNARLRA